MVVVVVQEAPTIQKFVLGKNVQSLVKHHRNPGFWARPGNAVLSLLIRVFEVIMSCLDKHGYSTTVVGQVANKHQVVSNVTHHTAR